MKRAAFSLLAAAVICQAASLVQQAPRETVSRQNPFDGNESARRAGAKLYARECAACHGTHGEGIQKTPPLKRADIGKAPPGALFWVVKNGALWHGMPSFAHMPELQRWQIVTFVRSLGSDTGSH